MRCEIHKDRDAVGACTRCGRGVCADCRARPSKTFLCKECLGMPEVPPGPPPMAPLPPPGPPQVRSYFMVGGAGAVIGAFLMFTIAVMSFSHWNLNWNMGAGSPYAIDLESILFLSCTLPFFMLAMGCYGVHWNYRDSAGLVGAIGLIIFWPLTLLFRYLGLHPFMLGITLVFLVLTTAKLRLNPRLPWTHRRDVTIAALVNLMAVLLLFIASAPSLQGMALFAVGTSMVADGMMFLSLTMPVDISRGAPPLPARPAKPR